MFQLYNTMSRAKEVFQPRENGVVKMFTCGPSIYRRPHIGNYRSFVWEDVLQRYLEYQGYRVDRVLNFTDVEDKAIEEGGREGISVAALTEPVAERFHQEADLLSIKLPSFIPRSSTSVDEAVRLIQTLLEKGMAYWHEGDIFFDPLRFEGFGKLFRLDMSRWPKEKKRFRRDTYPGRRWNLGDFILWHGYRNGDSLFWETPLGKGRPAWNIQDPAMIVQHLGFTIDIACGGIDNMYRHHDYNIAVIEGVSGEEFARTWVHGEHLLVNGKKMSKSLGNIVYLEHFQERGYTPRQVRFYLLYGHHRKQLNLTWEKFGNVSRRLDALQAAVSRLLTLAATADQGGAANEQAGGEDAGEAGSMAGRLKARFEDHMNDDLDLRGALDAVSEGVVESVRSGEAGNLEHRELRGMAETLRRIDAALQVIFP